MTVSRTSAAGGKLASPGWLKWTTQVPVPLSIMIVAVFVPLPEQTPVVVIATGKPELAVAATLKLEL